MSDWKLELSRELTLAHKLCTYTQYWVIKHSEEEEETVRVLVEMGGDVRAQRVDRFTPLHLAAVKGQAETVRVLVEMGADVHAQILSGHTPLHCAAVGGHTETMRVLVEMGHAATLCCCWWIHGNSKANSGDGGRRAFTGCEWVHLTTIR
jgi:ankyrin repeat protein